MSGQRCLNAIQMSKTLGRRYMSVIQNVLCLQASHILRGGRICAHENFILIGQGQGESHECQMRFVTHFGDGEYSLILISLVFINCGAPCQLKSGF